MDKNYYRGYSVKRKRWFTGAYTEHIKREPCALNDELRPEDIEHLIIFQEMTDWNLPRKVLSVIVEKDSIGQAVGLADRNGKVIFEGDYLIVHDENLKDLDLFKVIYDQTTCCFCLKNLYDDHIRPFDNLTVALSEVLGNEYLNKEDFESNCK